MTSSRADADRTALEGSVQSMLRKAYDMGISGSPFDIVDEANRLVDVIEDDFRDRDSVLEGMPARAWLNVRGNDQRGYVALIQMPKVFAKGLPTRYSSGEGDSKHTAVRNAIANATASGDGTEGDGE